MVLRTTVACILLIGLDDTHCKCNTPMYTIILASPTSACATVPWQWNVMPFNLPKYIRSG